MVMSSDVEESGQGFSASYYRFLALAGFAAFPLAILLIVQARRDPNLTYGQFRRYIVAGAVAIVVGVGTLGAGAITLLG
jgi:hypothetical protein